PSLTVLPAIDIDEDALSYEFEVYDSDRYGREGVLHSSAVSNTTFWQVSPLLPQDGWYYWRARAIDEHGLAGQWAQPVYFFADSDGVNDAPRIKLDELYFEHKRHKKLCEIRSAIKSRLESIKDRLHNKYGWGDDDERNECRDYAEIEWKDYDPDSNAYISLYYSNSNESETGTLIVEGLREDPDHRHDKYKWDVTDLADGVYFVYAVIDDGTTRVVKYSPNAMVIGDGAGQPYIEFKDDDDHHKYYKKKKRIKIKWNDLDSDSNASIALYYDTDNTGFDGSLIVSGLEEDPDKKADQYKWDISELADGKYYIYAIIQDGIHQLRVYSREEIRVGSKNKRDGDEDDDKKDRNDWWSTWFSDYDKKKDKNDD
ncbi:MAG: hypothetical protein OQK75_08675, partial [Gammaproteobacteria bacterium]|nr:hypothetical protein [Gammaproteobacteria bacterium]